MSQEKKILLSISCLIRIFTMITMDCYDPHTTVSYNPLNTLNNQGPFFHCSNKIQVFLGGLGMPIQILNLEAMLFASPKGSNQLRKGKKPWKNERGVIFRSGRNEMLVTCRYPGSQPPFAKKVVPLEDYKPLLKV